MRWITRENIKVDRVACPWLITRFVDRDAEFIFVPETSCWPLRSARTRLRSIRPDSPVTLNHRGDRLRSGVEDYTGIAATGTHRSCGRCRGQSIAQRRQLRVRGAAALGSVSEAPQRNPSTTRCHSQQHATSARGAIVNARGSSGSVDWACVLQLRHAVMSRPDAGGLR